MSERFRMDSGGGMSPRIENRFARDTLTADSWRLTKWLIYFEAIEFVSAECAIRSQIPVR